MKSTNNRCLRGSTGERLKQLRIMNGFVRKMDLARHANVPIRALSLLEKGSTKNSRYLTQLAKALNTNIAYLLTGEHSIPSYTLLKPFAVAPLLHWHQVEKWIQGADMQQVHEKVQLYTIQHECHKALALRIEDDSMINDFKMGDIVIFDAEPKRLFKENDYILVLIEQSNVPIMRKYIVVNDQPFLKPLNPIYSTLPLDASVKVIGTLLAYQRSV
jgi:SOS-response transcriptional repressor LexA